MKTNRLNPLATRIAVAVALTLSARGANITWVGNTSVNWADTNWSGTNNPPIAGDVLIFGVAGSAGPVLNNNLTAGLTFNGITFNPGGSAFTFNGNGITLAGNVTNSGTALQTINLPITSAAVTARLFTTTTGGGDITLGGLLSGNLSPSKAGVGTLNITGTANTYVSETIFGAGIVNVASLADYGVPSSLGARTLAQENNTPTGVSLHFRGGALQYTGSTPQSTNRNIRILNGVNGGIIDASGSDPSATLSFTKTGANINLFDTGGTRTMNLIGSNTGENSFWIQLTNQAAAQTTLRKAGTGTWFIKNTDNTYTGETIFEGGILNVASVSDYGVASSIGSRTLAEENNTVTGVSLHFLGGTLQYTGSTPQSTNRNIRVFIGNGATFDASGSVPSATLSFTKTGPNQNLFDTGGARTITLTGSNTGDNGFSIPIDNQSTNPTSLTKSGVGTWVLNGPDTNPGLGATTVNEGVLKLAKANALAVSGPLNIAEGAAEIAGTGGNQIINTSTVTFTGSNGALRLKGLTETVGGLSSGGGGFVENEAPGTGTLTVSFAGSQSFGGTIRDGDGAGTDGVLAFTKSGSGQLVLSGVNTHTGATTVDGGTLTVDGTLGAGSAVAISNATVNGTGTINGPVNVQVGGTLASDGTLGGLVTVGQGGTLAGVPIITGSVVANSGSLISPATSTTAGTLTTAALTLNSGSTLAYEFGGTSDLVDVTNAGGLTLNGGALNLFESGGVTPLTTNGTYTLFDYNTSFAGALGNLTVGNSQVGKFYSIANEPTGTLIQLTVTDVTITEWNGGAANGLWTTAANWTLGVPNAVGAVANFGTIPSGHTVVAVDGGKTVGGILLNNPNGYTLTGGATDIITLNNGVAAATIAVTAGDHTIAAPIDLVTAANVTTAAGTTLTVADKITGAKPFATSGAGTTILNNTNSFTTTTVNGGTLQVGNGGTGGTLGTSDISVAPGATLVFNRSNDIPLANNLLGAGAQVTKLGAGTLTLSGTNSFATATGSSFNINAGAVKLDSAGALPTGIILNFGGGTLDLNGRDLRTSSLSGTSGSITDNGLTAGTTTIFVDQAVDTTYAGSINNGLDRTIAVRKSGTGALTLSGSNSFTGALTITQGAVVAAGTPDPSILSSVVQLGDGSADVFLTAGAGAPQQFGANTVINFTNGGANAKFQTRGTTQTVAGLDANAPFQTTKAIIQNDDTLSPGFAGDPGVGTLIIDTDGTHSFTGLIRNEIGTLNLVKEGTGTQEIKNALVLGNNFGSITVNEGKFIVNLAPNAGGTNTLGAGTTAFIGTEGTLAFDGTFSFNQAISGTGNLLKQGTGQVTLTATNTFIGTTTLQGGNLVASAVGGGSLGGDVRIGNGTQAGIFLIMTQPNQFGPNSVLTWNNGAGDAKLELRGTAQTVAGLRSDPDDVLSIVQNQESGTAPAAATLTITATEDHVFTGLIRTQIGGPLSLVKNGPGTQEIRNIPAQAHNFGNLTIDEGKFVLNFNGVNNTLGAGTTTTIAAGAILGLDGTWNMNRTINGAGKVLKSGNGAVILSGTQAYAELETIGNGTLTLASALPNAAIDNTSGALNINASVNGSSLNVEGTTNISVSQTLTSLTSLTIAAGGTVVLGPAPAPDEGAAFVDGFGGDAGALALGNASAASVEAVPEPGALGLLATGVLGMLARRRRVGR